MADDKKPKKPTTYYTCNKCRKVFKRKYDLGQHFYHVHIGAVKFRVCKICGEKFATTSERRDHLKFVHKHDQYKNYHRCAHCKKPFPTLYSLARHELLKHSTSPEPEHSSDIQVPSDEPGTSSSFKQYRCATCGAGFDTEKEMTQHTKQHKMKAHPGTHHRSVTPTLLRELLDSPSTHHVSTSASTTQQPRNSKITVHSSTHHERTSSITQCEMIPSHSSAHLKKTVPGQGFPILREMLERPPLNRKKPEPTKKPTSQRERTHPSTYRERASHIAAQIRKTNPYSSAHRRGRECKKCEICNRPFSNNADLQQHRSVHFESYVCVLCFEPFVVYSDYIRHIHYAHIAPAHYQAATMALIESFRVSQLYFMLQSQIYGTPDFLHCYDCPYCDQKFRHRSDLDAHITREHAEDVRL